MNVLSEIWWLNFGFFEFNSSNFWLGESKYTNSMGLWFDIYLQRNHQSVCQPLPQQASMISRPNQLQPCPRFLQQSGPTVHQWSHCEKLSQIFPTWMLLDSGRMLSLTFALVFPQHFCEVCDVWKYHFAGRLSTLAGMLSWNKSWNVALLCPCHNTKSSIQKIRPKELL